MGCKVDRPARLADGGWLVGWLVGWLIGWSVDFLSGSLGPVSRLL